MTEAWASSLVAVAALAGAAGVAEAAYAAHGTVEPLLQTSSHFLLFHAATAIGLAAFALSGQAKSEAKSKFILFAASLLLLGTVIFCSDLSVRALTGARLFPMAAPIGGSLQIIAWLLAAVAAIFRMWKRPA